MITDVHTPNKISSVLGVLAVWPTLLLLLPRSMQLQDRKLEINIFHLVSHLFAFPHEMRYRFETWGNWIKDNKEGLSGPKYL